MDIQPFLASEHAPCPPERAGFHILPVPLERSVSYGKGAAMGPAAILEASQQLEAEELGRSPGRTGFFTAPPIPCGGDIGEVLSRVSDAVEKAVELGALPVLLGGEHTATLGALRALAAHGPFGILQFDAHADLRDSYLGDPLSHACVMRRALEELHLPLAQVGVRELCEEEFHARERFQVIHHDAERMARQGMPEFPLPGDFPKRIYVSFDVDALDPSIMPATGTPSPGGLLWWDTAKMLERCLKNRTLVGMDIVELAPIPGLHHPDYTAAKLVHVLMAMSLG
jgi:agmatinase